MIIRTRPVMRRTQTHTVQRATTSNNVIADPVVVWLLTRHAVRGVAFSRRNTSDRGECNNGMAGCACHVRHGGSLCQSRCRATATWLHTQQPAKKKVFSVWEFVLGELSRADTRKARKGEKKEVYIRSLRQICRDEHQGEPLCLIRERGRDGEEARCGRWRLLPPSH